MLLINNLFNTPLVIFKVPDLKHQRKNVSFVLTWFETLKQVLAFLNYRLGGRRSDKWAQFPGGHSWNCSHSGSLSPELFPWRRLGPGPSGRTCLPPVPDPPPTLPAWVLGYLPTTSFHLHVRSCPNAPDQNIRLIIVGFPGKTAF